MKREIVEVDCSKCPVTLRIRLDVSNGRMVEIARQQGWQIDRIDAFPPLCPGCAKGAEAGEAIRRRWELCRHDILVSDCTMGCKQVLR